MLLLALKALAEWAPSNSNNEHPLTLISYKVDSEEFYSNIGRLR